MNRPFSEAAATISLVIHFTTSICLGLIGEMQETKRHFVIHLIAESPLFTST